MNEAQRRRWPMALVGAVCAAFIAGMVARDVVHDGQSPTVEPSTGSTADAGATGRSSPGPARYTRGVPAGFARSTEGATAAAVAFVLTGQALIDLPPASVAEAVRAMSSTGSAEVQVSTTEQQLEELRRLLARGTGPTRYLQAVIATRVDAFAPDRARVSVWNVGVLSRAGVAAPQAGWSTSVFDLVWERGDWKVWSETITPGPAPALNAGAAPATSEQLEAALDGFTPWEPSS